MRHKHTRRPRYRKIVLLDGEDLMVRFAVDTIDQVRAELDRLGLAYHRNERGVMVDAEVLAGVLAEAQALADRPAGVLQAPAGQRRLPGRRRLPAEDKGGRCVVDAT